MPKKANNYITISYKVHLISVSVNVARRRIEFWRRGLNPLVFDSSGMDVPPYHFDMYHLYHFQMYHMPQLNQCQLKAASGGLL